MFIDNLVMKAVRKKNEKEALKNIGHRSHASKPKSIYDTKENRDKIDREEYIELVRDDFRKLFDTSDMCRIMRTDDIFKEGLELPEDITFEELQKLAYAFKVYNTQTAYFPLAIGQLTREVSDDPEHDVRYLHFSRHAIEDPETRDTALLLDLFPKVAAELKEKYGTPEPLEYEPKRHLRERMETQMKKMGYYADSTLSSAYMQAFHMFL